MLTVAVARLRELWPGAEIAVITNAPDRIARQCHAVSTVPVRGRRLLLENRALGQAHRWLPEGIAEPWDRLERQLLLRRPRLVGVSLGLKAALGGRSAADATAFLDAVDRADLVVVNGAGVITDAFRENALGILTTLDLATRRGVATALLGQGLGPIEDPVLWQRAAEVLPNVGIIGVRESRTSVPLLTSLGVCSDKVVVTGDDAVELAFSAAKARVNERSSRLPTIGVNVRVASYADVATEMLSDLRRALTAAAAHHGASMTPIPIAHHGGRMDVDTLRELLAGQGDTDGGAALDTPQLVIDRVGDCRVVVTGSYHGAVFALAQGIPVVALVKSPYYVNKMAGLRDQFGIGCELVRLDEGDVSGRIRAAIDRAWAEAERVRVPLLQSAAEQIDRGRRAYARLLDLVPPADGYRAVDGLAAPRIVQGQERRA
jgi:colanic acid/amylovoran biosynthesis protein